MIEDRSFEHEGDAPDSKLSYLASVSATREVLERFGLATKKALGQHFLINDGVVRRICDLAEVSDRDVVLEVGPGIGTLTVALLRRAKSVIAIERDADLPQVLAQTTARLNAPFMLIEGDALQMDSETLPCPPDKLVANLPYAVAATIVLDAFERLPIQSATVMVQAEVADRMMAHPGTKDYGAYTVKLGLVARPTGRFNVSEGNFFPPPRVKSAVVRLDRKPALEPVLVRAACIMADAAFANRRKTLANSVKNYFSQPTMLDLPFLQQLDQFFEMAQVDPSVRGERLIEDDFLRLGRVYLALHPSTEGCGAQAR